MNPNFDPRLMEALNVIQAQQLRVNMLTNALRNVSNTISDLYKNLDANLEGADGDDFIRIEAQLDVLMQMSNTLKQEALAIKKSLNTNPTVTPEDNSGRLDA